MERTLTRQKIISAILTLIIIASGSRGFVLSAQAAAHAHTDDCYSGEKHLHEGTKYRKSGCYQGARIPGESHECGTYRYTGTYIRGYITDWRCYACGVYGPHDTDYEYIFKCDNCESTSNHMVTRCNSCGDENGFDREQTYTHWTYDSDTYELSCGMEDGKYYDNNKNECFEACSQVVINLIALKE